MKFYIPLFLSLLLVVPVGCKRSKPKVADIPQLIKKLESDNWKRRKFAAMDLGELGPKAASAVPHLIVALDDSADQVRRHVIYALGHIGEPAVSQLIPCLNHKSRYVRKGSQKALARMGDVPVPALIQLLKNKDKDTRKVAVECLEEIGPPAKEAVPALKKAREKDESWSVKRAAKDALEKILKKNQ